MTHSMLFQSGDDEFDFDIRPSPNTYPGSTMSTEGSIYAHNASSEQWAFAPNSTPPLSTIPSSYQRRASNGMEMTLPSVPWPSGSGYRSGDSLDTDFPLYPRRYSSVRTNSATHWTSTSPATVSPSQWSSVPDQSSYWDPASAFTLSDLVEESKPDISQLSGSRSPSTTSASETSTTSRTPASPSASSTDAPKKSCSHCHATSTPLWRREPGTLKPLCNACGLYLQQRNKLRPQELIDADQDNDQDEGERPEGGPECSHCHTRNTSVWRRSKTGAQLCNACGVYARLRGRDRPLSLKRNKIKPRSKHAAKQ
ncbi:hypothetical protein BDZ89DRAFT_1138154 [Hymenopellis radicata]|nr:hypothetical protein BDZ89DRAFT_1138154 [Hymenopellis radicata]